MASWGEGIDQKDQILMVLKNLVEKKQNGNLSTLDRKILSKIQRLVHANPKNYSQKTAYLQILYGIKNKKK